MGKTVLYARESVAFDTVLNLRDEAGEPLDITGWTFALQLARQAGTPEITLGMVSAGAQGFTIVGGESGELRMRVNQSTLAGVTDTTGNFTMFGDLLGTPSGGGDPEYVSDVRFNVTTAGVNFPGSTYTVVLDLIGPAVIADIVSSAQAAVDLLLEDPGYQAVAEDLTGPNTIGAAPAAATAAAASASAAAGSATAAGTSATNAQNYMLNAQAISLGSVVSAKGDVTIGSGAASPLDGGDGSSIAIGDHAANGTSQTYSRKIHALGLYAGNAFRGYAALAIGAYTASRAVSEYGVFLGTHAGQDYNKAGVTVPGFGVRATGSITFAGVPTAGDTVTVNGVVFTAGTDFAVGASAAAAAKNLLVALIGSSHAAVLQGLYRLDSTTAAVVQVASSSRGTYGNGFTLAKSGANIAVSGAALTGGSEYTNTGIPIQFTGDVASGFTALGGANRAQSRKALVKATMGTLPADGATFKLGFLLTKTVTFKTSAAGALDVQIGASVAETIATTTAVLNGSADTTIDDVTYWGQGGGVLLIEHDSANVNTFECASQTAALVFAQRKLWGGMSNTGANLALGQAAGYCSILSGSVLIGGSAGANSTGANQVKLGLNSGTFGNGRDWFVSGDLSMNYCEGDDVIAIGRAITGGAQDAWLAITSIAIDGTITFATPHGWREGHQYACLWRDRAASGATIQSAPAGTTTWTTRSTALTGISVVAINDIQAKIIDGMPEPLAGGRNFDYRVNGTASNIDVARYTKDVSNSVTLGAGASPAANRVTVGASSHVEGLQVDAIGANFTAGQVRFPSVIGGVWATGNILFASGSGNFADGETVTLNGTAFTAKSSANLATANNSAIRWFAIGGSMWESLNNLLTCIRNSDDQSAAAKAVKRARFYLNSTTGTGWRLQAQALDTGGNSYTLATSKGGATVTAMSGATLGNLPNAASTNPPKDKGMVMLTASPLRDGNPGPAIYDLANDRWTMLP